MVLNILFFPQKHPSAYSLLLLQKIANVWLENSPITKAPSLCWKWQTQILFTHFLLFIMQFLSRHLFYWCSKNPCMIPWQPCQFQAGSRLLVRFQHVCVPLFTFTEMINNLFWAPFLMWARVIIVFHTLLLVIICNRCNRVHVVCTLHQCTMACICNLLQVPQRGVKEKDNRHISKSIHNSNIVAENHFPSHKWILFERQY